MTGLLGKLFGSPQMHNIAGGETLGGIAQQYGTTQSGLMGMNPQITDPNMIYAGQQMQVGQNPGFFGNVGQALKSIFKGGGTNVSQHPYVAAPSAINQPPTTMGPHLPQSQQTAEPSFGKQVGGAIFSPEGLSALTGGFSAGVDAPDYQTSQVTMPQNTWSNNNSGNSWY